MSDPNLIPASYDDDISREWAGDDDIIDPDCIAGKHASCIGDPCVCVCHEERK